MNLLRHLDRHSFAQEGEGTASVVSSVAIERTAAQAGHVQSARYSDQPMGLGTRMFGLGGVGMVALLIIGGVLFTWRNYAPPPAPATLSVFDVAPPAAPPEPQLEIPPGPEQVERKKPLPVPEQPPIEPPLIRLHTPNVTVLPLPQPVPDPGPPIDQTTAPKTEPAAPAPQASNAQPTWQGAVLAALNKAKRYPRDAQRARQQGVPWIRFVMNREGKILSSRLEQPSGFPSLDIEAVSLPQRAQPLPKPPDDVKGESIELVVPVEYVLRR